MAETAVAGPTSEQAIADIMNTYRARIDGITEKLNRKTPESYYRGLSGGHDGLQNAQIEELILASRERVDSEMSNLNDLENELFTELNRLSQVISAAQETLEHNEWQLAGLISARRPAIF